MIRTGNEAARGEFLASYRRSTIARPYRIKS